MFFAKLVASTIALFTLATASPVLEARSCSPNFQGVPLTIFKTEAGSPFQWEPTNAAGGHITLTSTSTPFAESEFFVAFSGQPDGSYVFKFVYIFFPVLLVGMDAEFKPFFKNRLTADTAHAFQLQGFANGDLSVQPIQFTGK